MEQGELDPDQLTPFLSFLLLGDESWFCSLLRLVMGEGSVSTANKFASSLGSLLRWVLFRILSVGPIPNHIALIMDGNRRYAKTRKLEEGNGHRGGFLALLSVMKYCYEVGVKYMTIYAFSIDNFKRKPREVQSIMDLMLEKIKELLKDQSIVNQFGIRVYIIGNLGLVNDSFREAAEKLMSATAKHSNCVLLICVAYTSSDEIVHAVQESCRDKRDRTRNLKEHDEIQPPLDNGGITLVDIEKFTYMSVAPDPDILIRTSGETRLSNFLVWQTDNTLLFSPKALWPEIGLWHLVWAIVNYQRSCSYLEKKKQV